SSDEAAVAMAERAHEVRDGAQYCKDRHGSQDEMKRCDESSVLRVALLFHKRVSLSDIRLIIGELQSPSDRINLRAGRVLYSCRYCWCTWSVGKCSVGGYGLTL